jgi:hypothetical protein
MCEIADRGMGKAGSSFSEVLASRIFVLTPLNIEAAMFTRARRAHSLIMSPSNVLAGRRVPQGRMGLLIVIFRFAETCAKQFAKCPFFSIFSKEFMLVFFSAT